MLLWKASISRCSQYLSVLDDDDSLGSNESPETW
jgi:hypothetical protein